MKVHKVQGNSQFGGNKSAMLESTSQISFIVIHIQSLTWRTQHTNKQACCQRPAALDRLCICSFGSIVCAVCLHAALLLLCVGRFSYGSLDFRMFASCGTCHVSILASALIIFVSLCIAPFAWSIEVAQRGRLADSAVLRSILCMCSRRSHTAGGCGLL